ncbi:GntR family transcriptional regulator [Ancylobacter mangrovi]|uniref:GntR family transcriptional regulator n=1 Tax=Ancylobacter mangrovi TaxID=2972472 RepID=UPI002161969C|nr:GntR family transcriptional regulator [Ancylobacter mangrovi]MCS0502058.1 GntR family transcriptional regulator [Ancylobacter mangrovi]
MTNRSTGSNPPAPLEGDAHLPLYRRLYQTIAGRITSGDWRPGDALPAELDLARLYGVAPGTVRKAIDELVDDGLIERRHGSGTFIRRPNFDNMMVRFLLYRDPEGREIMPASHIISREIVPAPATIAHHLGMAEGEDVIRMVRHRHWEGAARLLEDIYLPPARFRPMIEHSPEEIGPLLYPAYERLCGQLVCFIEEEITILDATPEDAALLGLKDGDLVVAIERIAKNASGQPIEWRISRGEARRFRYRISVG